MLGGIFGWNGQRPVRHNVILALAIVLTVNASIFISMKSEGTGTGDGLPGDIPGWFVGLVWTGLFVALGFVRGLMLAQGSEEGRHASAILLALLVVCAIYPLYTSGLRNDAVGLAGNVATAVLALWCAVAVASVRRAAASAPLAVVGWLAFASATLIDHNRWLG